MHQLIVLYLLSVFLYPTDTGLDLVITYDVKFQKYESKSTSFESAGALLYVTDKRSFYIDRAKLLSMKLMSSKQGKFTKWRGENSKIFILGARKILTPVRLSIAMKSMEQPLREKKVFRKLNDE